MNPFSEPFSKITGRKPRLCFTGSRDASPLMLESAARVTRWAIDQGWWIVVGDAMGVDRAVVLEAMLYAIEKELPVTPLTCMGIYDRPRNRCSMEFYIKVDLSRNTEDLEPYIYRDHLLVDDADGCVAFWNSISDFSGTLATFRYANKCGKPTLKRDFDPPTDEDRKQVKLGERMTPEERKEAAQRGAETRRKKKEQA